MPGRSFSSVPQRCTPAVRRRAPGPQRARALPALTWSLRRSTSCFAPHPVAPRGEAAVARHTATRPRPGRHTPDAPAPGSLIQNPRRSLATLINAPADRIGSAACLGGAGARGCSGSPGTCRGCYHENHSRWCSAARHRGRYGFHASAGQVSCSARLPRIGSIETSGHSVLGENGEANLVQLAHRP